MTYQKIKVDTCQVCILSAKANSVLCLQCGKCIHGMVCGGIKMVTPMLQKNVLAENVKGILERQWSRKKSYAMKWKL